MKKVIQGLALLLGFGLFAAGCSSLDFASAAMAGDNEGMINAAIDMAVEGAELLQDQGE